MYYLYSLKIHLTLIVFNTKLEQFTKIHKVHERFVNFSRDATALHH